MCVCAIRRKAPELVTRSSFVGLILVFTAFLALRERAKKVCVCVCVPFTARLQVFTAFLASRERIDQVCVTTTGRASRRPSGEAATPPGRRDGVGELGVITLAGISRPTRGPPR